VGVSCMPARSVLGNSCQSYGNDVILQRERDTSKRGAKGMSLEAVGH
jgi:hypothetical protein